MSNISNLAASRTSTAIGRNSCVPDAEGIRDRSAGRVFDVYHKNKA